MDDSIQEPLIEKEPEEDEDEKLDKVVEYIISNFKFSIFDLIENQNYYSSPKPLKQEMKRIIDYLSEFKLESIGTPFKGTSLAISKDKSAFYFGSRESRVGKALIKSKEIISDTDLEEGKIWAIALSENDKFLFSGGEGGTIKKFSVEDMDQVDTLKGHTNEVNVILISSDDKTMYSTGDDKTVLAWDITIQSPTPRLLYTHNSIIYGLDLSFDNKYLASAGGDAYAKIYDLSTNSILAEIENKDTDTVWCVKITKKNNYLAIGTHEGHAYLYKFGTWELLKVFSGHKTRVRCITATHDESLIITGGIDNNIILWDIKKNRSGLELKGHRNWVKALIVSEDNKNLYSISDDKSIKIWRLPKFDHYIIVDINSSSNFKIANPSQIVIKKELTRNLGIIENNILRTLNSNDLSSYTELDLAGFNNLFVFNPIKDELCVITLQENKSERILEYIISFYSFTTLELIDTYKKNCYGIFSAIYSPDGVYLILGELNRVSIVDLGTKSIYHTFVSHKTEVTLLCQSPDLSLLFSADTGGIIKFYDFKKLKEVKTIPNYRNESLIKILVSPDSQFFVVLSKSFNLMVWSTFKLIRIINTSLPNVLDIQFPICDSILYCLYQDKLSAMNFPNLDVCFQIKLESEGKAFCFGGNSSKEIAVFSGQSLHIYKNPLNNYSVSVYGDDKNIMNFYNHVSRIIDGTQKWYENYSNWIIEPFHINVLHLYAYYNKIDYIEAALKDGAGFFASRSKFTPLDICLETNLNQGVDVLFNFIKETSKKNPVFVSVLKDSVNRICKSLGSNANQILDLILCRSLDTSLSKFHHSDCDLPLRVISHNLFTQKGSFVSLQEKSNDGIAIEFTQTYFPMNMVSGSDESINFLNSVVFSNNDAIFLSNFIQTVLECKWNKVKWILYVQGSIFFLYLIFLIVYILSSYDTLLLICLFLNFLLISYELFQGITSGIDYFKDFWNYIDFLRSISVISMFCLDILLQSHSWSSNLYAIVLFFSLFRGYAYFRLIKQTRYYINLIGAVFIDIIPFITILLYSTVGFGLIFFAINQSDPSNNAADLYIRGSWEMNLGSFSTEGYSNLLYIFFIMQTLMNPIIMFNLLVAIMSDTFSRVSSGSKIAENKELASMVLEAELILFSNRKKVDMGYIHVCNSLEFLEDTNTPDNKQLSDVQTKVGFLQENQNNVMQRLDTLAQQQKTLLENQISIKKAIKNLQKSFNDVAATNKSIVN